MIPVRTEIYDLNKVCSIQLKYSANDGQNALTYTERHIKVVRLKLSAAPIFPLHHNHNINDEAESSCFL